MESYILKTFGIAVFLPFILDNSIFMDKRPKEVIELEDALGINFIDHFRVEADGRITSIYVYKKNIKDLSQFEKLTDLKELHLVGCKISDIKHLQNLNKLISLSLAENQISEINPIYKLNNLINLDLSRNHINDIHPLKELKKLQNLYLQKNKISYLAPIRDLIELRYLHLSNNEIYKIEDLAYINKLILLAIENNKISDIKPIEKLIKLRNLGLGANLITDIEPLKHLKNLRELYLNDNEIQDITFLSNLKSLKLIDLINNRISDISSLLFLIKKGLKIEIFEKFGLLGKAIFLNENPLLHPPISIIEKGNAAILEYFERMEIEKKKGTRPINEAKLIIIGEPESGKTTLMNYLQGKPFTVPSTTQGFTIEQWKIKEDNTDYRINIWDFGGQDIQSTVHQFFFTQDTLYLLVLNARKDELPDKYIEQIKSYAPNSPIIIIVNRIEENPSYELGVKRLQDAHKDKEGNSLIRGVFKISLLKGLKDLDPSFFPKLEEMKHVIQKSLLQMPHIHRLVPNTYLDIKEYLESVFFAEKPYISHDTYAQICRDNGLNVESDEDLLGYLNNLGTIRYFDDLSLRSLQILNPEWLSDGVYRILVNERTKQLRGIITEKDLEIILQKTEENQFEYPKRHYNYLIQMIRKFDMGYLDEITGNIFIPRAFGLDYVQNFDAATYKNNAIHFFFKYETFIPSTIMPGFISRMFAYVKENHYNQNGIVLQKAGQIALVEQTSIKNRIDIWVSGSVVETEYFEFFIQIRNVFREFHDQRKGLSVDELIGLNSYTESYVKYKQLLAMKFKNVLEYVSEDGIVYNIDTLLGRFESKNTTIQHIQEQHVYQNFGGDMYAGHIFLVKQSTRNLLEILKANKAQFLDNKQVEIEKMINELENIQSVSDDRSKTKSILHQLNETWKNITKISSEEAVKWFTKEALSGRFNDKLVNLANKAMKGFQNPLLRDIVEYGSNVM